MYVHACCICFSENTVLQFLSSHIYIFFSRLKKKKSFLVLSHFLFLVPLFRQVLEDINPTDEELRQSQQRVHHPKREARIGEGKSRSGRGLSAWLGTNSVSGSGGRGKGSGEGGDGSGLSGGAANAGHGTSSGNSPGASPAEEAVTTKNMAGSNRTVGNDFRGHGEVAGAGPSHGRRDIPPASAGSGGQEVLTGGSDRFRGVYGEDVAQRERGLGMGLDVVGGLGLQGSAADGDSTARGMWGREERMAQVVVAEEAREQVRWICFYFCVRLFF